jgi:hypothetical protein
VRLVRFDLYRYDGTPCGDVFSDTARNAVLKAGGLVVYATRRGAYVDDRATPGTHRAMPLVCVGFDYEAAILDRQEEEIEP